MPEGFIPVAKPWTDEREVEAVSRVIRSGWVTQGPEVAAFEKEFAEFVGASYACAVSSCTTALHLALLAVGVGPGDEVITVSHSFIATANSIRYCGAIPVFVDVDPSTYNMDPSLIESVVSNRTRAIVCVHQMGMPCDLEAILKVARRHDVKVVEDAACAVGSEILWQGRWEKIGRPHGDIACFSFHPRKILTTGDGGMITTNRKEWDEKFRLWRQHGMTIPDTVRHHAARVVFESYDSLGFNYRMTDLQAAFGREQLKKLPEMLAKRRRQAQRYRDLLKDVPGLRLPEEPPWARTNWQSYCVRLPDHVKQHEAMQAILDQGVATRRGIMCAHREKTYVHEAWSCGLGPGPCGCPPKTCARLRQSEKAQDRCVLLPMFHEMTEKDQNRVADAVRKVCAQ